jgi:hypothetical protein
MVVLGGIFKMPDAGFPFYQDGDIILLINGEKKRIKGGKK